jgi:hypothetical protein
MLLFSCNIELHQLACNKVLYRVTTLDNVNNDVNRIYLAHDRVACRVFMNIVVICRITLKGSYFLEKLSDFLLFKKDCAHSPRLVNWLEIGIWINAALDPFIDLRREYVIVQVTTLK